MVKQPDGFWAVTTPPLVPGLHYYTLIVDGAEVDPGHLRTAGARQRGEGVHSKRACALVASARYGRYLKQTGSRLAIDARAVAAAEPEAVVVEISVVVTTYNRPDALAAVLEAARGVP